MLHSKDNVSKVLLIMLVAGVGFSSVVHADAAAPSNVREILADAPKPADSTAPKKVAKPAQPTDATAAPEAASDAAKKEDSKEDKDCGCGY